MGRRPRSSGDQSAAVLRRASQVRVLPRAPFFDIMKAVTDRRERGGSTIDLPLVGPQGEPIDLLRTLTSHGLASLPPMSVDEHTCTLDVTVPIAGRRPRTVRVTRASQTNAHVTMLGPSPSDGIHDAVRQAVGYILRLDEDLSSFYSLAATDPDLAWAAA